MIRAQFRVTVGLALTFAGAIAASQTDVSAPFSTSIHSDDLAWTPCTELVEGVEGCTFAVIRGELESGPAEIFVRLAPGAELPRIRHAAAERGLILQGALVGRDVDVSNAPDSSGRYWYLPPNTVHGGVRCGGSRECLIYESYDQAMKVVLEP